MPYPVLRALQHKNYRLFFFGQSISLIGTWMTRVATGWLVYRLTHSAIVLGCVSFAGQIPTFLIAPLAGVYIDRWNLRRVLLVTQVFAMIQSLMMAVLTLAGLITIPQIIVFSVFQGLINGFDMPARQAFLIQMVDNKEDLGNAIALNSSMVHGARLIGPSIAGFLIVATGEGMCFLIDAISYLAVIVSLWLMTIRTQLLPATENVFRSLREGFTYALRFHPIRDILWLLSLVSFMGMPYMVLMPIFADQLSGGGPKILGFLMGASGLGAFLAGLSLAARKSVRGLGKWMAISSGLFGSSLIAFSVSHVLWLSMILVFLAGFSMMLEMAASNTILQTIVDDNKRGRVMSFYTMSFMGMAPLGSLFSGFLANKIGASSTLVFGGVACILGALYFSKQLPRLRRLIRPVYLQKGIIPENIFGVQAATDLSLPPED